MLRSALRTLAPLRHAVSVRLCSGAAQMSAGEKKIADLLRQRFPSAATIVVDDISGGCGSMYQVAVESDEFKGKAKVQQHKMVTETLQKEIADMHGIVINTKSLIRVGFGVSFALRFEQGEVESSSAANKKSMTHHRKKRRHARRSQSAKSVPPLLNDGEVIRKRYTVDFMIGGGGFGQIFKGTDMVTDQHLAIKVEPADKDGRRIKLEFMLLVELRGSSHIPVILASGTIRGCSFIVMTLLGKNLSDLRKEEKSQKFSRSTVYRIGQHLTTALRHVHGSGYVHRDMKPANACIGLPPKENVVYLVDFGMVRQFRDKAGNMRRSRNYAGFRGTVRYAPPAVHQRKEMGPVDDLIGLLYSMIELSDGALPWAAANTTKELEAIKENLRTEDLCRNQPKEMVQFAKSIFALQWDHIPDYKRIHGLFEKCIGDYVGDQPPFDWEVGKGA
ncbi:hypothetical protein QR680_008646 [Steinernema hermaphroditum]|uniref:Protein kinase domain-containing protein n=1 Tax=Steinernema hermaphroditum TaxID=289476 RepID=A0AA39IJA5_9BILA|nr:hypothetical protein QR680_008646 [Steinernema hermaphroditum]